MRHLLDLASVTLTNLGLIGLTRTVSVDPFADQWLDRSVHHLVSKSSSEIVWSGFSNIVQNLLQLIAIYLLAKDCPTVEINASPSTLTSIRVRFDILSVLIGNLTGIGGITQLVG